MLKKEQEGILESLVHWSARVMMTIGASALMLGPVLAILTVTLFGVHVVRSLINW